MNPLFEPNPAIANLARVCDAIRETRERARRDTWNDSERRAFVTAAKACGADFASFNVPRVDAIRDPADVRIREREQREREARETRQRPASRAPVVYATDDEDDGPAWRPG